MPRELFDTPQKVLPFTIVIDSNEQAPYTFTGISVDGDKHKRRWVVPTTRKPLFTMHRKLITLHDNRGQFTKGLADYSIDGREEEIQIERKSLTDLYGTLGQRRNEFEAEFARLQDCKYAAVIVEAEWSQIADNAPAGLNAKSIVRTMMSWNMRYGVNWWCVPGRRVAEVTAFHILYKWWMEQQKEDVVTRRCKACMLEFSLTRSDKPVCTGCGINQKECK